MKFVKIAQTSELAEGTKKKIILENREILLVNLQNSYYALDNKCPHMGGSLFDGTLESGRIICPRHSSEFDVTTGKNLEGAKILFVRFPVKDAQTFPVKVEGSDILIEI